MPTSDRNSVLSGVTFFMVGHWRDPDGVPRAPLGGSFSIRSIRPWSFTIDRCTTLHALLRKGPASRSERPWKGPFPQEKTNIPVLGRGVLAS